MTALMYISAAVMLAVMALAYSKANHPYLTAAKNAISGISALLLINLISGATGCYIGVNTVTVFISTVLSLPGVLALLVMKIIFNY